MKISLVYLPYHDSHIKKYFYSTMAALLSHENAMTATYPNQINNNPHFIFSLVCVMIFSES